MRKGGGTLDGGGGGEHSQTRFKIYLCMRFRVRIRMKSLLEREIQFPGL